MLEIFLMFDLLYVVNLTNNFVGSMLTKYSSKQHGYLLVLSSFLFQCKHTHFGRVLTVGT